MHGILLEGEKDVVGYAERVERDRKEVKRVRKEEGNIGRFERKIKW